MKSMKDIDIKMSNLEEEVTRLAHRNSKLEGVLGRLRANIMALEFPNEHQESVDKIFEALERSFTSL